MKFKLPKITFSWGKKQDSNQQSAKYDEMMPKSGELVPRFDAFAGQQSFAPAQFSIFDGAKFPGGFGPTQLFELDYWTLRKRSGQLFRENLYARGLIRRLITNEINTGLTPEALPDEEIIGVAEDSLDNWSETVENRFALWGKNPKLCDWNQVKTFGAIQRTIRAEALIDGDILVILRQSQQTRLPLIQLVSGGKVRTPLDGLSKIRIGHKLRHGVETNKLGRVVAYWIDQDDGSSKRISSVAEKTGRRVAWLVFGVDKRMDDVRGEPLLSLVLQSLKEIDRYRDAASRKAVINSILAMFIKKTEDKPSALPVTNGAVRKDTVAVSDGDGTSRDYNIANQIPGVVMEELQTGEEPVGFHSQGTDLNFGVFEEAIIQTVAWCNEIPPEILRLAFSNNYSASQAAINEFKIYLNMRWTIEAETVDDPVYQAWLLSEVLNGKINAPGLLDAWRDISKHDVLGAWMSTIWYGSIKPSTDMLKQAKGSELLVKNGWSTNSREARITTGTKYSKNTKRLKRENEQLVEAMRPLAEFKQEFGVEPEDLKADATAFDDKVELIIDDYLEDRNVS